MNFRNALEVEEKIDRCSLKIMGSAGCGKRDCACGNAPYALLFLIAPNEDIHGAAIQTVEKMDELISSLRTLRNQLWGDRQ